MPRPVMMTTAAAEFPSGDPALLNRLAWTSRWSSRDKSRTFAARALTLAEEDCSGRSDVQRGLAFATLAWQAKWRGDFDTCEEACFGAKKLLPEADHPEMRAHVLSLLAVVRYSRNRLDLAAAAVARGMALIDHVTGREAFVDLLTTQATIQRYNGDRMRAGMTLSRARELSEGADLPRVEHNIARWLMADGATESALSHARRAIDEAERRSNRVILPYALEILGAALAAGGAIEAAAAAFRTGFDIAAEDGDTRAQCQILGEHADLERRRGDLEAARALCDRGAEIARRLGYCLWEQKFALALAAIHEEAGNLSAALAEHKRAWNIERARRT